MLVYGLRVHEWLGQNRDELQSHTRFFNYNQCSSFPMLLRRTVAFYRDSLGFTIEFL